MPSNISNLLKLELAQDMYRLIIIGIGIYSY